VVAAALAVYVFCCFLKSADLLGSHSADVGYYGQLARSMRDGAIPYRDLYVEYPPGALPVFAAPAVSLHHYGDIFSVLMALCGALALLVLASAARALDMSDLELGRALAPLAVAPFLLGSVFLNRYDPWPMLLTALALAALIRGRLDLGSGSLALAGLAVAVLVFALGDTAWIARGDVFPALLMVAGLVTATRLSGLFPLAWSFLRSEATFYPTPTRRVSFRHQPLSVPLHPRQDER